MPPLSQHEKNIIVGKGTEKPFTGKYWSHFEKGVYSCRQCGADLYRSDDKFSANCGWPNFDDEIAGAVKRVSDADGRRTEILCASCDGHLGHVFIGEGFTPKNTRHCVNSASMVFKAPSPKRAKVAKAYFAGGCFWGMEHHFRKLSGVLETNVGYTGGRTEKPTYQQVCTGKTGHAEAIEIIFDPRKTTYEKLAREFFEIHDPTQLNRQGNDKGTEYRSAVFYANAEQKAIVETLIAKLRTNGYNVVTDIKAATRFWPAEEAHQDYLRKNPNGYNCHVPVSRFDVPAKTAY